MIEIVVDDKVVLRNDVIVEIWKGKELTDSPFFVTYLQELEKVRRDVIHIML